MTLDPTLVRLVQRVVGTRDDGVLGPATLGAIADKLGVAPAAAPRTAGPRPADNVAALNKFYGPPGESHLVEFEFPFPMRLYSRDGKVISRTRCHRRVAASLAAILEEIRDSYGSDWIEHHGLHVFGGIYHHRTMRGGTSLSRHSWGIAIDLNPAENALHTPWRQSRIGHSGFATMPAEAIDIFERHGWKSGARAWGRDAMHFQATS